MATQTFTITLKETGKSISTSIFIEPVEFINPRWTTDKEGKNKIKKAKLGETVFFHTDLKGYREGTKLNFQLVDYDTAYDTLHFLDIFYPDDYDFPDQKILKQTTVKSRNGVKYAFVELYLNPEWENKVANDALKNLDLYWQVHCKLENGYEHTKSLPNTTENYLKVTFSDQDLFINPATIGYEMPEIITYDGSPIVIMDLSEKLYGGKVQGSITNAIKKSIDKKINKIALVKLEKGMLVNNKGGITVKNTQIYGKNFYSKKNTLLQKDVYTNEGKLLENLKVRKNVGNKFTSSKPINQYDYFTKTGKRVKILRVLKKVGNIWDFFSVGEFLANDKATSSPLSFPMISPVTNIITEEYEKIFSEAFEAIIDQEIAEVKAKGLAATRSYVNSQKHNFDNGFDWRLMSISNETANQLLNGKFETFEEMNEFNRFDFENVGKNKVEILYKESFNDNKEKNDYIIETIFINE